LEKGKERYLVSKKAEYGLLRNCYYNEELADFFSYPTKIAIMLSVANAIKTYHDNDIVHGNAHSNSIFVYEHEDRLHSYLSNFYASHINELTQKIAKDAYIYTYLPPELFNLVKEEDGHISPDQWQKPADIYMFGYLMWEIYYEDVAYRGELNGEKLIEEKEEPSQNWEAILEKATPMKEEDHNDESRLPLESSEDCPWRRIMNECWQHDPRLRPTIEQVISELEVLKNQFCQCHLCTKTKKSIIIKHRHQSTTTKIKNQFHKRKKLKQP